VTVLAHWEQRGNRREIKLDYGFASLRLGRSFDVRVGKVKHPGSLYGEVFGVGTIRPFLSLPQSVYSTTACLTFDSFTGVGLNGHLFAGNWDFGIVAYGGGGNCDYLPARLVLALATVPNAPPYDPTVSGRENLGGRLTIRPPLAGLQFGMSAFRITPEPPFGLPFTVTQLGGHFEYATDMIWLRSEIYHQRGTQQGPGGFGRIRLTGYYGEAASFCRKRVAGGGPVRPPARPVS